MLIENLSPGFWRIEDTCNVYLLQDGDAAIAIDFGSGAWLSELGKLGVKTLDAVYLTHHHADQCFGLRNFPDRKFAVHAPSGEDRFLSPKALADATLFEPYRKGCPSSYAVLRDGLDNVLYNIGGFSGQFWRDRFIRFIHTPGHGPNACSIVIDHLDKQLVFCGDAARAGATIHLPYNLEIDHWTGAGALLAWQGVVRLSGIAIDTLCPSHGPIITQKPVELLKELADKLMAFYLAKGQISPQEPDRYVFREKTPIAQVFKISPNLYQVGANSYVLTAKNGECLVMDPNPGDIPRLEELLKTLNLRPTVSLVSHYHLDHCLGAPYLRERYGTRLFLHESVAGPIVDPAAHRVAWILETPIPADAIQRGEGEWRWNEYAFRYAPWPGQTWWHCVYQARIDGQEVMFGGDSFQPTTKWNGTGGFCAYNRSRFADGFIPSARLALRWAPDIVANGHTCAYRFAPSKFEKIIHWAEQAETAIRALCPSGDLDMDYYPIAALADNAAPKDGALFWGK